MTRVKEDGDIFALHVARFKSQRAYQTRQLVPEHQTRLGHQSCFFPVHSFAML